MWKQNLVSRLKRPSTILSLIAQVVSILLLMGVNVNESLILSISAIACSILVALGILSNPDTETKGYGDDILHCSNDGKGTCHVKINGQMICKECGAVYTPRTENS